MKRVKLFLRNTLLLTATALLLRLMGMGFQVYLSRRVGAAGIGLYELLMSAYGLAGAVAVAGVRLSTTRLVLELPVKRGCPGSTVMALCLGYSLALGIGACLLLRTVSAPAAASWLDAPELAECLDLLAWALPCMALSACLNGCFFALRQAGRMAAVQMGEFLFHAGATIALFSRFSPSSAAEACRLLCISALSSEIFCLGLSALLFQRERDAGRGGIPLRYLPQLLEIAVPDAVGSWVRSGLVTAKHFLIPKGLRQTGIGAQAALAAYGVIQGMALPILAFPSALMGTVSALLIPEIAEAHAKGQLPRLHAMLTRVLHVTLLLSFFTAAALLRWGDAVGRLLYRSEEAARYVFLLAPITPLMYLDTAVDGILKGLGLQTASMRINILDAALSLLLVWQLIPRVGVPGYLFTIYFSETLNFLLSYRRLYRTARLSISFYRSFLAPLMAAIGAVCAPAVLLPRFSQIHPLFSLLLAGVGYGALLMLLGAVRREDVHALLAMAKKGP